MFTVNALFPGLVSVPLKLAEPVFAIEPVCFTVTLMLTTMVWPPGRVAVVHVTLPPSEPGAGPVQLPILLLAEPNCRLDGSVFVKTTFGALTDP